MTSGNHAIAILAAACAAAAGFSGRLAAQNQDPAQPRLVWAAKPVPPMPYVAPNRLIWRIADILAARKGQASWRQLVAVTRDFEGEWVSMAPGEKTKRMFYADDRAFWFVYSGAMRVRLEGQEPFVATKGFLVQAAPRIVYSTEAVVRKKSIRTEFS